MPKVFLSSEQLMNRLYRYIGREKVKILQPYMHTIAKIFEKPCLANYQHTKTHKRVRNITNLPTEIRGKCKKYMDGPYQNKRLNFCPPQEESKFSLKKNQYYANRQLTLVF